MGRNGRDLFVGGGDFENALLLNAKTDGLPSDGWILFRGRDNRFKEYLLYAMDRWRNVPNINAEIACRKSFGDIHVARLSVTFHSSLHMDPRSRSSRLRRIDNR